MFLMFVLNISVLYDEINSMFSFDNSDERMQFQWSLDGVYFQNDTLHRQGPLPGFWPSVFWNLVLRT